MIRGFTKTYCKRPLASTYIKNERHAFLASFWGYMNEQPVRSLMSCLCYCIFQAAVFMGFSITSALLGGLIILIYSFWIDVITSYRSNNSSHYDAKFAVAIIILILGVCSLVAGISAAISVCLMNPCNCCAQTWVNTHKKLISLSRLPA